MNLKILRLPIVVVTLILLSSNLVFAALGQPNQFYGYVTVNGQPAPDGTSVIAKINGVQVASTTTSGGRYGYNPVSAFYVDDPNNNRAGDIVNFFVNGVEDTTVQPIYFCNGCVGVENNQQPLNLSVTVTATTTLPGGAGGGGGAPGGGTIQTTTTTQAGGAQQCQERWLCSDWSACANGIQTRTCSDANKCGTNNNEPMTAQPCSAEEETEGAPLTITGFVSLVAGNTAYLLLIALLAVAVLLTIFRREWIPLLKRK